MNTNTGELYDLSVDESTIEGIQGRQKALEAMARGETVVPVSDAVVQKVRLGERELMRRRRRRQRQMGGAVGS